MAKTEAQKRTNLKYLNSKYRPDIRIDKEKRSAIESRIEAKGFKSINQYVNHLIDIDCGFDSTDCQG